MSTELNTFSFDTTAFMSGQIRSKLWLLNRLEQIAPATFGSRPLTIWFLGGWYGMIPFLLAARGRLRFERMTSFDIDDHATQGALAFNENLVADDLFRAFTRDVSSLQYTTGEYGQAPDLIVNTSVEHMPDDNWWAAIPTGSMVLLQSNDMPHDDHVDNVRSLAAMEAQYAFTRTIIRDELQIGDNGLYRRFMLMGEK